MPAPAPSPRSGLTLPASTTVGFAVAVIALVLIAAVSYRSLRNRTVTDERVAQTFRVIEQLDAVLSTMKDAETGQRGFILTADEVYLEPYQRARSTIEGELTELEAVVKDSPVQANRASELRKLITSRMSLMADTVDLVRAGRSEEGLALVKTGRGRTLMASAGDVVAVMHHEERRVLAERQAEAAQAASFSFWVSGGGSVLLFLLILGAAYMTARDYGASQREAWLRTGQTLLSTRMQGEQSLEKLGEKILAFVADYLGAQVGTLYAREGERLRRLAGFALPPEHGPAELRVGEGLLGEACRTQALRVLSPAPPGYLPISSTLGRADPHALVISPAVAHGTSQALIELGFLRSPGPADQQLLSRISESVGMALVSAHDRGRLEELLAETQRQAEELQAQQEELRVSNEELEEQSRALKESQARLESQHAELEQTNSQLEQQTRLLEQQKDDLSRAQEALTEKANELARASQYKSEFLANMSHELRTPLNSSLILAKLLADNKEGNLNEEQVKYAQTISAAGNDLLELINEILDLSKIEAGMVEVQATPVNVARAVESLLKSLAPMAEEKGLQLSARIDPATPEKMETDGLRLGQILKNLLSNAIKFTAHGSVTVDVSPAEPGRIAFAVTDTGIGIPADKHEVIFEAFRQADGSTHRKYGGTGLGLAISRDLAKLLGGDIHLRSAPGEGSTFTLVVPTQLAPVPRRELPSQRPPARPPAPRAVARGGNGKPSAERPPASIRRGVADDRDRLKPGAQLVLVIEDDEAFAAILRDLAHELGFQCVVTHGADEGLLAASTYRPSGILLDMNLPDHSGLGVLDQLKHNAVTRHIPVHVLSVADYTQAALGLGAIGYALKPVKREQLVAAFRRLESKLTQQLRRVLVLEDDERQRESIRQLLSTDDVEIVGVETAEAALVKLRHVTFDCMVMDLNLPDMSGYELLEKMAQEEGVSIPPIIVYTGHALTRDEEQQLRRFSRAIIIKDARSPERLVDEVTLFLHQVESNLPPERRRMIEQVRHREAILEGRRILVVEDDVRNIFALSRVLEPRGARVEIARNGKEAVERLASGAQQAAQPVDLVLMDIMMPEMDGLTAMREIRKVPSLKKLPIIALTAKAMRDDHEKCIQAGANDYIAKPLDVEKLLSLVRVWMPK